MSEHTSQHVFQNEYEWLRAIQLAVEATQSDGTKRPLAQPEVRVTSVSASGFRFELEMRFRTGLEYCCSEPGCHVPTNSCDWWDRLRSALALVRDRTPGPMSVRTKVVVERGARLQVLSALSLPIESEPEVHECEWVHEADAR